MIENWKDTAFGSDFGMDFLEFIEKLSDSEITLELIYNNCDLKKYIEDPSLLTNRTNNNVFFKNSKFEQYVHFEDAIIALSAIIVESEFEGKADLTKAYGNKTIKFNISNEEKKQIANLLEDIYKNPDNYILFEMCLDEERQEIINDIKHILTELKKTIN